ncbi:MAG: OsmC family protein [Chloroflexota bacterium]
MLGTLRGALAARQIDTGEGRFTAEARGDIGKDGDTLRIRRIHVDFYLRLDDDAKREAAERAHRIHADHCPVALSIRDAIEISTSLHFADAGSDPP